MIYIFNSDKKYPENRGKEGNQRTKSEKTERKKDYNIFKEIYPEKKTSFKENERNTKQN